MIITIDGPAGAGKSTIARALAERLRFRFLDTGAMYRAVTWAALQRGVDWNDRDALIAVAAAVDIHVDPPRISVDGVDCTLEIRDPHVTRHVGYMADLQPVRARLVELQRNIVAGGDYVTEGRDQGTEAFPRADVKFYLTASPDERARRRFEQLQSGGQPADQEELLRQQNERDAQDRNRPVGALIQPPDAIEIASDGIDPAAVVALMEQHVRAARNP